jgi:transposase
MVFDHTADHESQWSAMRSIAEKIGCTTETLRHGCGKPSVIRAGGLV